MQGDPESWTPDETPKSFQNPMTRPFQIVRFDEDNRPVAYEIAPLAIVTYPTYIADFLINHLTNAVINDRNLGYLTPEERAAITAEILTIDGTTATTG